MKPRQPTDNRRQAEAGDAQARAWLAKYLCGDITLSASLTNAERQDRMLEGL